jgi:glycosyltransferase involved in cell wall biosynthesis
VSPAARVAVLTAVHRPRPAWLLELHESIRAQHGPAWRWAVQLDGEDVALPAEIVEDERVEVAANGRRLGAAATRNLALARVDEPFVQNVDHDDLLLPGALAAGVEALEAEPDAALAFGRTVHLEPDGRRTHPWRDRVAFPVGRIEAGAIPSFWLEHGRDGMPMSPVIWRRDRLVAIGGWPALPALYDPAAVMAAAELWPAVHVDADVQLYRLHDEQTTGSAWFEVRREADERFVRARIESLRRVRLTARGVPS